MTIQVEFHTGVGDDVAFAQRLLRKAYGLGARVLVRGPAVKLAALDRLLWTQPEREFVPHLRWSAPRELPPQAPRTPIWLVEGEVPPACPSVLVNLGEEVPAVLEPFARVIEVVAADADGAAGGRARWREYRARGIEPLHHEARGDG